MRFFFSTDIRSNDIHLAGDEHRHLSKVLRVRPGEEVLVLDGAGALYTSELKYSDRNESVLKIQSVDRSEAANERDHLVIAPTKNQSRMEWLVEKCTEMGLAEISFLRSARSEKTKLKEDRIERIAQSALKQSGNRFLPKINFELPFDSALELAADHKYIAHCIEGRSREALKVTSGSNLILIGPEGDFVETEVEAALEKGFRELTLGDNRLRTETAGFYVVSAVQALRSI
jgi:16S rRNA (uracil1498-N3)-methyltransferase